MGAEVTVALLLAASLILLSLPSFKLSVGFVEKLTRRMREKRGNKQAEDEMAATVLICVRCEDS